MTRLLLFILFITFQVKAATVLLAKGNSAIISTGDLKNEFVGTEVFIASEDRVVAVAVITKIIKEDVKALVKVTKGSLVVGQRVFMSTQDAYDWIQDGGATLIEQLTPDFLVSEDDDEEEYGYADEESEIAEARPAVAEDDEEEFEDPLDEEDMEEVEEGSKGGTTIAISGHAGLGVNADGLLYRFGGTVSFHPQGSWYYLADFNYSIVNFTSDEISLGSGVTTIPKDVTYPLMMGGVGVGYTFGSFYLEGLVGASYYDTAYTLTANNASNVDFTATTLAVFYGARVGYKKTFGSKFFQIFGGMNMASGTSQTTLVYSGSTTESESSLSDREFFANISFGFEF